MGLVFDVRVVSPCFSGCTGNAERVQVGGEQGCRAKGSAGLNFCLMGLANVLTVRNATEFLRKENIIRYLNIYRLQHQHWYELKN